MSYADITEWTYLTVEPQFLGQGFKDHCRNEIKSRYENRLINGYFYCELTFKKKKNRFFQCFFSFFLQFAI